MILTRTLQLRTPPLQGSDVRELQKLLCAKGFLCATDGIYGPATAAIVQAAKRKIPGYPPTLVSKKAGPYFVRRLMAYAAPTPSAAARALVVLQGLIGIVEYGGPNAGARVEEIQRAGADHFKDVPWCQLTQNYARLFATGARRVYDTVAKLWNVKGGKLLAKGTASVPNFVAWERAHGNIVAGRPISTDYIAFVGSDGVPYHVGQIEKVLRIVGIWLYLVTIEGNTGPSNDLSHVASPRDAIRRKSRIVLRSSVVIVRDPGA